MLLKVSLQVLAKHRLALPGEDLFDFGYYQHLIALILISFAGKSSRLIQQP